MNKNRTTLLSKIVSTFAFKCVPIVKFNILCLHVSEKNGYLCTRITNNHTHCVMTTSAPQMKMETMTIEFPKNDTKRLKGIAKAMGWTLRKLETPDTSDIGRMGDLSDEECWEYLCATRPEGFELLSEEEEKEFEDWLGIKR